MSLSKDQLRLFDPNITGIYLDKRAPKYLHVTLEPDTITISFKREELEQMLKEMDNGKEANG